MHRNINGGSSKKNPQASRHPAILRASSVVVGGVLAILLVTSVVPPIVADQSDRAVVNAPLTLLTAPIDGEIESLSKNVSNAAESGDSLARISNPRLDRGTLISLEEKTADARAKLEATQQKKNSDRAYVRMLDAEIANQSEQLRAQFQSQIAGLRAKIAETDSLSGAQKALVDRQTGLVARNVASMDMLKPTKENYSAALHKADAARAGLDQKVAQLDALEKGIYVGDDLVAIGILVQKRRDIDLDARRMEIEEKEGPRSPGASTTGNPDGSRHTGATARQDPDHRRHAGPARQCRRCRRLARRLRQAVRRGDLFIPAGPEHEARIARAGRGRRLRVRHCHGHIAQDVRQGRRTLCGAIPADRTARTLCDHRA
jgi:multidrug efflux pump subunit AcrA (membrane-fusion protein)